MGTGRSSVVSYGASVSGRYAAWARTRHKGNTLWMNVGVRSPWLRRDRPEVLTQFAAHGSVMMQSALSPEGRQVLYNEEGVQ